MKFSLLLQRKVIAVTVNYVMWNQEHFRYRLRFTLQLRNISQKRLAKMLSVNPATITRWQGSRANYPSLDKLHELARTLKVPVCWLALGCPRCAPKEFVAFVRKYSSE